MSSPDLPTLQHALETLLFQTLPSLFNPIVRLSTLRLAYLASLSHQHLRACSLLTKRDVHYLSPLLFPTPASVDSALRALSTALGVTRNDLSIVAAPRGIVAGAVQYTDELGYRVHVRGFGGGGCLLPPRPERIAAVHTEARAVVVVEKEAALFSLLDDPDAIQLLDTCIFVTGKGYPDFATRAFLQLVTTARQSRNKPLPVYIITDADPHGMSIAHCYIQALSTPLVRWIGVRPSDHGRLFHLHRGSLLQVTPRENALVRNMLLRFRQHVGDHDKRLDLLTYELQTLQRTQLKFEMEALACVEFQSGGSGMLAYLLLRADEEFHAT